MDRSTLLKYLGTAALGGLPGLLLALAWDAWEGGA